MFIRHLLQPNHNFVTINDMKRQNDQAGSSSLLLIVSVLLFLLLIGISIFAIWAFNGRQDFKNNVNQKIGAAVAAAKTQESAFKDSQFAEQEKLPLRTFVGPEAYGSINISYPKNWSSYVAVSSSDSTPVNGYFQPDTVPSVNDPTNSYALRVEVVQNSYDQVMANFQGMVQSNQVSVAPYQLPKVLGTIGSRIEGQIVPNKNGSMIVLPLRDKTIEIWTEASQYEADFNTNILPNLSFSP